MKRNQLIIKRLLLVMPFLVLSFLFMPISVFAQDNYTLYLVRHAEKQINKKDPKLTACGRLRAQHLATFLEKAHIQAIYSTPYQRTLATAKPLSQQQNIAIKSYSPTNLEQFALHLMQLKENILVVGHSNTTPMLTQLLSEQQVKSMNENEYQTLFQIQFIGDQKILTEFKQPLICQ